MERMTLRQAAFCTTRSVTTLRRYIRSGRLHADKRDGRFGPEYFVSEADLVASGLDPRAGARLPARRESEETLVAGADAPPTAWPRDVVPLALYQELQMKHEQLLVQYGMVRAGGLRTMELRGELETRQRQAEAARETIQRLRRDAEQQAERLREAQLELHGRAVEIEALQGKVRALEMLTRNAATSETIDRQFQELVDQARRVRELVEPLPHAADPAPARRVDPDH